MGFLVGYGILSVGAIHSLATRDAPPKVDVGSRIKVWLRASDRWSESAKIESMDADSIVVFGRLNGRFAKSEIDSLRVKASTGRWAEGWAVGLIVGGVVGAGLGSRISRDEYLDAGSPAKNALAWAQ